MMYCRWSPSLGKLESTHQKVWGTKTYNPKKHINEPCVFFGIYGLPDFYTLWRHKGKKYVFWAGSDILHLLKNYWLDEKGDIRIGKKGMCLWLNKYCENWCENDKERVALAIIGIQAKVCQSFLGDVNKFKVTYEHSERPKVYASVSGNDFEKYGWNVIKDIAPACDVDFYLYGNTKPFRTRHKNIIVRGRVPKQVMNREVAKMQCGLRAVKFDGFSEVLAKAVLMGQYPISYIKYPHIDSYKNYSELIKKLNGLKNKKKPNLKARKYYFKKLNKFPWSLKK